MMNNGSGRNMSIPSHTQKPNPLAKGQMMNPKDIAIQSLKSDHERGLTIDQLVGNWWSHCSPDMDGNGSVWIDRAGGYVFPDRTTYEPVKLKSNQIAVVIHHKNSPSEWGVYDMRELWQEITNPKPIQLVLF
jgi:hypothetical protein